MTDPGTTPAHDEDASQLERIARRISRGARDESAEPPTAAEIEQLEAAVAGRGDAAPQADIIAELLLSERYKGSFPHPEVLRRLDDCVENGAERAFALTELEQKDRHGNNRRFLDAKIRLIDAEVRRSDKISTDRRITIVCAFIVVLLSLAGAFTAIMVDKTAGAAVLGSGGLIAVITAVASTLRREQRPPDSK